MQICKFQKSIVILFIIKRESKMVEKEKRITTNIRVSDYDCRVLNVYADARGRTTVIDVIEELVKKHVPTRFHKVVAETIKEEESKSNNLKPVVA